jgi:hypothetical protein
MNIQLRHTYQEIIGLENLTGRLKLHLHPDKVFIKTLASGVDFLGWVHFPTHRVLRTTARRRMMARIIEHGTPETVQSYGVYPAE